MQNETWGKMIFVLGIIVMFLYTTFSFLWAFAGISSPYPLALDGKSEIIGAFAFFAPPFGAFLMVIGALICGLKNKEAR